MSATETGWFAGARALGLVLAAALCCMVPRLVFAHETLPASLRLDEVNPQVFTVVWRLPATQGPSPAMQPVLPKDCVDVGPHLFGNLAGAQLWRWQVRCAQGVAGRTLRIAGQENYLIDTVVRATLLDGTVVSRVARPREPSVLLDAAPNGTRDSRGFFTLGVEHILGGVDHLLFVFCLLLWIKGFWPLVRTITGFTAGHSITLTLASLGLVQLPGPPMEACIALSIVFLAVALAKDLRVSQRSAPGGRPWLLALVFGLLHGFGFASALAEVGLPADGLVLALLGFNLGVEAGQLLFVVSVLVALGLLRVVAQRQTFLRWQAGLAWERAAAYGAGSVSVFWLLQRLAVVVAH